MSCSGYSSESDFELLTDDDKIHHIDHHLLDRQRLISISESSTGVPEPYYDAIEHLEGLVETDCELTEKFDHCPQPQGKLNNLVPIVVHVHSTITNTQNLLPHHPHSWKNNLLNIPSFDEKGDLLSSTSQYLDSKCCSLCTANNNKDIPLEEKVIHMGEEIRQKDKLIKKLVQTIEEHQLKFSHHKSISSFVDLLTTTPDEPTEIYMLKRRYSVLAQYKQLLFDIITIGIQFELDVINYLISLLQFQ